MYVLDVQRSLGPSFHPNYMVSNMDVKTNMDIIKRVIIFKKLKDLHSISYKKAVVSSRNPRGPGQRRPSKERPPERNPKHKRVKIPVKTMEVCNEKEENLLDYAVNSIGEKPLEERLEYVMERLQNRLPSFIQHVHDHG